MSSSALANGELLGVDVGGTNVRAAVVRSGGEVVQAARRKLQGRSPQEVAEQIRELITVELGLKLTGKGRLGVGLAAQLNPRNGVVSVSPNLGWRDVPFGELLSKELGWEVRLVNDLNAIAAGETLAGGARGVSEVLCVFVGTGLGAGVISEGRLLEGAHGLATELGHVKVASVVDGPVCGCGQRGCLETFVGGAHLPDRWRDKVTAGLATKLDPTTALTAPVLDEAAATGDAAAMAVWEEGSHKLAQGLAAAVTLFDPSRLVLGGGVWQRAPGLAQLTRERLPQYLGAAYVPGLQIVNSTLGDDAGVVGAAWVAGGGS